MKIPGKLKKKEKKQRKILPEGLIPEKMRYIITEFDQGSTVLKKGWKHEKNAFFTSGACVCHIVFSACFLQ